MFVIVLGDDSGLNLTLKKNKKTFAISADAVINASIVNVDHSEVLAGPITIDKSVPGTNLDQSLIVVEFTGAETESILAEGDALIEVQVDDVKKKTWFVEAYLIKGTIS